MFRTALNQQDHAETDDDDDDDDDDDEKGGQDRRIPNIVGNRRNREKLHNIA